MADDRTRRDTPHAATKIGLTYLVPFCVTNVGILAATKLPTRQTSPRSDTPEAPS